MAKIPTINLSCEEFDRSMENQAVRRRTTVIAAHLACHEDISATATHVFPMSCSNSPNSFIRRYDNRMHFARQGSASQGCYMRQSSNEGNYIQPSKSTESKGSITFEAPSFSKPALHEPEIPTGKAVRSVNQSCSYPDPSIGAPMFARPRRERPLPLSEEKTRNPKPKSVKWSPRMDVVESELSFVVTLEIPGVGNDNVKVEVHDQSLIIIGNRSNWCCEDNSAISYHRREIFTGPYRIVWPLPSNADKRNVSAEIQDGVLRVTIPKLTGLRWLRKSYM